MINDMVLELLWFFPGLLVGIPIGIILIVYFIRRRIKRLEKLKKGI
jgi:cytochrome c-type biogenesis protein CcmH/NrfF